MNSKIDMDIQILMSANIPSLMSVNSIVFVNEFNN